MAVPAYLSKDDTKENPHTPFYPNLHPPLKWMSEDDEELKKSNERLDEDAWQNYWFSFSLN